jgi:hypothetical protein
MRNLCFTHRSLQFSRFVYKSLGNPISLPPLFSLSLYHLFFSPTGGASSWELFPCLPPSPPPGDGAGGSGGAGRARRGRLGAAPCGAGRGAGAGAGRARLGSAWSRSGS